MKNDFFIRSVLVLGLGALMLGATLAGSTQAAPRKKLIHLGWDQTTTSYLRDHWKKLDETAPFDGITFEVRFTDAGQLYTEYSVMRTKRWNREVLQKPLQDLRATGFTKLTNNFIRVNSPDDANRLDRLRQNLDVALDTADDMVWLYNEQVKWWEIGGETLPDWGLNGKFTNAASKRPRQGRLAETAFPGITQAANQPTAQDRVWYDDVSAFRIR